MCTKAMNEEYLPYFKIGACFLHVNELNLRPRE